MSLMLKYQSSGPQTRRKATSSDGYPPIADEKAAVVTLLKIGKFVKRNRRRVYVKEQSLTIVANPPYQKIRSSSASTVGGADRLRLQPPREWFGRPDVILSKLLDSESSVHERRAAVLFSSVTAFGDSEKESLLNGLSNYIEKNRFTQDESVLTVLGAAVRKYCMNMPADRFESTASWLLPSTVQSVSPIFEMELSKGIHWRLTSAPTGDAIAAPRLLDALEMASAPYLYASRLVSSATAAVAINLCIATLELGARMGEDDRLVRFTERMKAPENARLLRMVSRQLERDAKEVRDHAQEFAEKLKQLAAF